MVLAQWLERGLGQIFAPDPRYDSQADTMDTASSLWQTLAPDPNFSPEKTSSAAPPPHAFRQHQQQQQETALFSTPSSSRGGGGGGANNQQQEEEQLLLPMSIGKITSPKDIPQPLKEEILKAVFDTAQMAKRNGKYKNDAKNLFAWALQKRAPDQKVKDKLIKMLENDLKQHAEHAKLLEEEAGGGSGGSIGVEFSQQPPLYEARSINAGASCPDGLTPLQAAARSGAFDVAQMLLQLDNDNDMNKTILRHQLQRTNIYGQTAKHLAAESHREDMVDLIQQYEQLLLLHSQNNQQHNNNPFASPVVPQQEDTIDVMGRTPFGTLLTSPVPTGKKNNHSNSLRNKMFSPQDPSIIGSPAPSQRRRNTINMMLNPDIHTLHASAHVNGMRVYNEDALFSTQWKYYYNSKNNNSNNEQCCPVGFFIVCDGHGDCGCISEYVVLKLPQLLRQGMETMTTSSSFSSSDDDSSSSFSPSHDYWTRLCTTACCAVDLELKKLGWMGGTAAIFCLVTKDQIVVGNVGDSRCILVEHKQTPTSSGDIDDEGKAAATVAAAAGQESGDSSVENLAESMNQQLSLSGTDGSPALASPPSESSLLAVTGGKMTVVATALSQDHKADLPDERARVEKAGLEVIELKYQDQHGNDASRIKVKLKEGNRNMVDFSRSFGDFDYKAIEGLADHEQPIIAIPDVRIIDRHSIAPESYLVLACDGVWDVKSNDDVANFVTENVHRHLAEGKEEDDILSKVGDDLLKACIDSNDNLSTIIVALSQAADMLSSQRRRRPNNAMTPPSPSPLKNLAYSTPQK